MKKGLKFLGGLIATVIALSFGLYFLSPGTLLNAASSMAVQSGGFNKHTIEMDGEQYYYFDNENIGQPVLIFVHGFSDEKASWFPFVNEFSKKYRVIAPDLLGHGENKKDTTISYTFLRQAEFLKSFLDELNINQPHLIGASMGGAVVGKFASIYPTELSSVTFISSAGINGNTEVSALQQFMDQFPSDELKKENMPLLPKDMSDESLAQFKKYIFYKDLNVPEKLMKYYMKRSVENRDFYFNVMQDIVYTENGAFKDALDEELDNIVVPVLVIWGKQDPLLDVSSVKVFEDSVSAPLTVALIDDCGHATLAEQPQETRQPIIDFIGKLEGINL